MNLTFKPRKEIPFVKEFHGNWPRLIAFTGPAGSGKSTAAQHLVQECGYRRIRFADPIKDMLRDFGLTFAQVDGDLKETPCAMLEGKTPRRAMQTLGDEWGRQLIGPNVWVSAWERRVEENAWFQREFGIVVDDLRYPNELDAILRQGGLVIRVHRSEIMGVEAHVSENHTLFSQRVLINDGTPADLAARLEQILDAITHNQHAA